MEEFLKHTFFRSNEFSPRAAQTFLNSNADLLNRMPTLRSDIQHAIRTGDDLRLRSGSKRGFADPRVNKAVIFIEEGPDKAFNRILNSRSTSRDVQQLLRMAARDETGEATQGLKSAFSTYLLNGASSTQTDAAGNLFIDGGKLGRLLGDRKVRSTMMQMYTKEERGRFDRILRTARRLDTARVSGERIPVTAESLGAIGVLVARLTGAAVGRRVTNTIQGPAILSEKFQQLLSAGVVNPARRLIEDSIVDEDLFKALLSLDIGPSGRVPMKARRHINAWFANSLMNLGTGGQEPAQRPRPEQPAL
jgi:hypothetical protein